MTTDIDAITQAWAEAAHLPVRVLMSTPGSYDSYSKRYYEWQRDRYNAMREVGRRVSEQLFNLWLIEAHLSGAIPVNFKTINAKPEYATLENVLGRAYIQAAYEKGAQRHNLSGDTAFEDQRMQTISQLIDSPKGMEFQVIKKLTEGINLPTHDARIRELLGAINYLAGMVIYLEAEDKAKHSSLGDVGYEAAVPAAVDNSQAAMPGDKISDYEHMINLVTAFRERLGPDAARALVRLSGFEKLLNIPRNDHRTVKNLCDAAEATLNAVFTEKVSP